MSKPPAPKQPLPTREEIIQFISDNPGQSGKREIARAFRLDPEQKRTLKKLLREMAIDGSIKKTRGKRYAEPSQLPDVAVLQVSGLDSGGDPLARPVTWDDNSEPPLIFMAPERRGQPALGVGDRVLARISETEPGIYRAKTIRQISAAQPQVMGRFEIIDGVGRIQPTDRRAKGEMVVRAGDELGAQPGDLVRAEIIPGKRLGLSQAKVTERLDALDGPGSISLIAIHSRDIPTEFSADALKQATDAGPTKLGDREDLRTIPLVTIDGADARDFDDAVWAEPDTDHNNKGGWHLLVAIADVAGYVRPGSPLDRDARQRGNSVYFPDRVVPMLPEALSNGWCSLVPDEDRPCLAAHMWIDRTGLLLRHRFVRGLMRSAARLTYEQAQAAEDGDLDETTAPLVETVLAPLYGAYQSLILARDERGVLALDLAERQVKLAEDGSVQSILERPRLDSHRLIEEFMVLANVAAAEALEKKRQPCMYRIHDQPSAEKIDSLSQFMESIGLRFARGQVVKPIQFNQILRKVAGTDLAHMVNQVVLRSQARAEYNPNNIGHFGLALRRYCHFTSPIRRYSDLLVHRALITGYGLGEGGLPHHAEDFEELGTHISDTERRAAAAERDAIDRYTASFLADRVGATFNGTVNGVTRFGLFITLDETGADGLIPIRTLPNDYYDHDENLHTLTGRDHGLKYHLGQNIEVTLVEAVPLTGGLIFGLVDSLEHAPSMRGSGFHRRPQGGRPKPKGRGRGGGSPRKSGPKPGGKRRS